MFTVRGVQRLTAVLSPQGRAGVRSFAAAAGVLRQNGEKFAQIENPYKEPQRACVLCRIQVDYKNIQLLSQFISPHTGRIYGRHITGLCGRKQKEVAKAIKKAHSMGFMSVTQKHPEFMKDPNICSTKRLE